MELLYLLVLLTWNVSAQYMKSSWMAQTNISSNFSPNYTQFMVIRIVSLYVNNNQIMQVSFRSDLVGMYSEALPLDIIQRCQFRNRKMTKTVIWLGFSESEEVTDLFVEDFLLVAPNSAKCVKFADYLTKYYFTAE